MMHLAHPNWLWLLLLLPPLGAWWLLRRRAAVRFPDGESIARMPHGKARWLLALHLFLRLAVISLLILGLARPRWPDEQSRIPANALAVQIVLDVSGSMGETDIAWDTEKISRIEGARRAISQLLAGENAGLPRRFDDMIGLLTFAARIEETSPPTLSHHAIIKMLEGVRPLGTPPDSSTNIGDAMLNGLDLLRRARPTQKTMILITDGEHNVPAAVVAGAWKPRQAAQLARAMGIRIYTIFVGPGGKDIPEGTPGPDETAIALQDVATMTGGQFFTPQDGPGLAEACREIDRQERTRIESFRVLRYHEAYPWVGLLAAFLLVVGLCLDGTRWGRGP